MVVLLTHGLLKLGVGQSALRLPMGNGVNTWSLHFNDGWEGLSSIFHPFFEQNLQTSINIMSTSCIPSISQNSTAFHSIPSFRLRRDSRFGQILVAKPNLNRLVLNDGTFDFPRTTHLARLEQCDESLGIEESSVMGQWG